jgi:predicted GNAT superfamily acetyltransferase
VSGIHVRTASAADHSAALALNNAHTPHVNALSETEFAWIAGHCGHFAVADDAAGLVALVMCLPSGLDYWSQNYAWFTARYREFLYLDRVVVAPRARRSGIGRALYDHMHATVAGRWPRITLEVNLEPPNPISIAFHEAMGYRAVGVREYEDGAKAVQMFARELPP